MGWIKERFRNWLNSQPANEISINIVEPFTYDISVFRNQLWYRGNPAELHQFYSQIDDGINNTSFWSATSTTGIRFRKIHTGLPALIADVLIDIVLADLIDIKVAETEAEKRWEEISKDNDFNEVLKTALRKVIVEGDGAFKISYDEEISKFPIIEFYSGTRVRYEEERGRLVAVVFSSTYAHPENKRKTLVLEERYTKEGVDYSLVNLEGEEYPLSTLPQLSELKLVTNDNNFNLALPFMLDSSPQWTARGKSLFEGKSGAFDAFDEVTSQWMDALRDGRTTKYIPQTLVPQSSKDGSLLKPNPFDNRYVQTGADASENGTNKIQVLAGDIPHEALLASYTTILDLCLQGLVSPSTLGIDVKKLDNAEAQREKEKTTLYTRNKVIDVLEKLLPQLVETVLKVDDMLRKKTPGTYTVSISFGEYANPSFEAQVETIGKARAAGVMSIERSIEELYGDSLTDEEKAEEVGRLKDELGIVEVEEDYGVEPEPMGGASDEDVENPKATEDFGNKR